MLSDSAVSTPSPSVRGSAWLPSVLLGADEAAAAAREHARRADELTAGHRERKQRGEKHAVEDFLYTYYPFPPAKLRRYHPGWRAAMPARGDCSAWYRVLGATELGAARAASGDAAAVDGEFFQADVALFLQRRGDALHYIYRLLTATRERRSSFDCFGLHEWAMVYRQQPRHDALPLRIGREATDAFVERENLRCTHFDAFRFFTPPAVPLNAYTPTRERQLELDNPACLHANMDLYKWAMKLSPLLPSALALDCFELARDVRVLDMEASPYDVRGLGYGVVPIETSEGKAEYVRRQRGLAARADALRKRMAEEITLPAKAAEELMRRAEG
ncbi:3-methyladenine DNA glycosylase [Dermabacteraceae bacterium P7074]